MKNTIAPKMTTQRIFTVLFVLIIGLSTSFGTERRDSTSLPIFRGILSGIKAGYKELFTVSADTQKHY